MNEIKISKTLGIREAGYNEEWLQNQIWENPSEIGLGELESVTREKILSSGGRLDILLKNALDDSMYEVETMLGETDPSHIIRTIEYWDLMRKKWPQRQHYAVLIAEKITKRYFNVIQLLSGTIPLIAIQANIIQIDDFRSLHFTKVLDVYEEPDDSTENDELIDESYWETKSNSTLNIAKNFHKFTKDIYKNTELVCSKGRIALKNGFFNQVSFHKKSGNMTLVAFKYGNNRDEIELILRDEMDVDYEEKYKQFRFKISEHSIAEKKECIKKIAQLNNKWWVTE